MERERKDGRRTRLKYLGEKCRVNCRDNGFTLEDFDVSR